MFAKMREAEAKLVYEKPEIIDFEHWKAFAVKGNSCIGGPDDDPGPDPCISGSDCGPE